MNRKQAKLHDSVGKMVELHIAGHPVTLSFAAEPDATAAQRIRSCLIDSYINQSAAAHRAA